MALPRPPRATPRPSGGSRREQSCSVPADLADRAELGSRSGALHQRGHPGEGKSQHLPKEQGRSKGGEAGLLGRPRRSRERCAIRSAQRPRQPPRASPSPLLPPPSGHPPSPASAPPRRDPWPPSGQASSAREPP